MSRPTTPKKTALYLAMLSTLTPGFVYAGGFSLYTESSAVEIGNFAAGAAAEAVDASTGWYNPAGLVRLKKDEVVISGVGVLPSIRMNGVSTYQTESIAAPYVQSFQNLEGGEHALVPALHYIHRLGEHTAFGLSVVSPFGLSTNWGWGSPVRYAGTLTELTSITVAPELAAELTKTWSFGAGLDLQWARVRFNAVQGAPAALQHFEGFYPTQWDSQSVNQGRSFGVGFHAGVLGAFNDAHTRVGLNYQSRISHRFEGFSQLTGPFGGADVVLNPDPTALFRFDGLTTNNIEFPDIITLSAYQDITEQWALLGSVVYTGWNVFQM
ncbi:MAG: OmpP1/FadL family transporter [Legionellaceae bacterium]